MLVKRSFQSSVVTALGLTLSGTMLIASTYGMARFGVGLLHPAMVEHRPGVADALAAAGTAQFVSYCVASLMAGVLVPRRSRLAAGAAGVVAAAGCLGLAVSTSSGGYVASAFVAGAGAGLASPALVALADAIVPSAIATSAQAVINSGTAVGVMSAGAIAAAIASPAVAWPVMAGLCLASTAAVVALGAGAHTAASPQARASVRPSALVLPVTVALLVGLVSAGVWTFGPQAVLDREALDPAQIGLLWAALGLGGLAGALVGRIFSRWGPLPTVAICFAGLVVGSLLVLTPLLDGPRWPLLGAATFGAAYMALTGALILWGRLLGPDRGASITAWLFIALAVGQAAGAQLMGTVIEQATRLLSLPA